MFDRDEIRGLTALVIVLILIFALFIGLYLGSLDTSGQTFVLTVDSFHDDVIISIYNPIIIGKTTVNKGLTPMTLPRGNYSIKAELYRDYAKPMIWTKSFTLDRDMVVKVFD